MLAVFVFGLLCEERLEFMFEVTCWLATTCWLAPLPGRVPRTLGEVEDDGLNPGIMNGIPKEERPGAPSPTLGRCSDCRPPPPRADILVALLQELQLLLPY